METYKKTKAKNGISRGILFGTVILFQITWLTVLLIFLQGYSSYVSIALSIIAMIDDQLDKSVTGADIRASKTIEDLYNLALSK